MEWTRLSDLTGNDTYGALTQRAESYLLDPQPALAEPWPGLVGTNVDITDGHFVDSVGGWNGGDDSFYEYLIKVCYFQFHGKVHVLILYARCTCTTPLASASTRTGE